MIYQTNGLPTLGALGVQPGKWGNEFGFAVPANVYECSDGPIYTGVLLDAHWQGLAEVIDQPELADNEAFANREQRAINRDICNVMLADWLAGRTRAEAIDALRAAGLPAARVQTFVEVAEDPHVLERDMLQPTEQADGVTVPIVGPSWKFSRTPARVRTAAASLGEHADEILEGIGRNAAERQRLRDEGVLG